MKSVKADPRNGLGTSIYQSRCREYYSLVRSIHASLFSFNPERMAAERRGERYTHTRPGLIRNLYTFVRLLERALPTGGGVSGIDYGCGTHYFVDDVRASNGWDVRGLDADARAIEMAQRQYPKSAHALFHCDVLRQALPVSGGSQDFVLCNAVIQHFDDNELEHAFNEVYKILRIGGLFALVFKRASDGWVDYSREAGVDVRIVCKAEGAVCVGDEALRIAVAGLGDDERAMLSEEHRAGFRLLHVFPVRKIIRMARGQGFGILRNAQVGNERVDEAVFRYVSGRGIPCAAIVLTKEA